MLELNGRAVRRVLESNVEQQGKAVEPLSANEPSESQASLNPVSPGIYLLPPRFASLRCPL